MRIDRLYAVPADVTATTQWVRRGLEASFEHHLVDRPVDCFFADDERLHASQQHDLFDEIIEGLVRISSSSSCSTRATVSLTRRARN